MKKLFIISTLMLITSCGYNKQSNEVVECQEDSVEVVDTLDVDTTTVYEPCAD